MDQVSTAAQALPPWLQAVLSILMFCVAAFAWLKGMFSKVPAPPKDVAVPSVTIADSAAMRELANSLRDNERDNREIRDQLHRMVSLLEDIRENTSRDVRPNQRR